MQASLSTISRANFLLREFSIPLGTLASLSDIKDSNLSRYLRETKRIGGVEEKRLQKAVESLKRLIEFVQPLPLDFRQAGALRRSIDAMESGELQIVMMNLGETNSTTL